MDTVKYTSNELHNWIDSALEKEDIKNYKIEIKGATENGDGYLGNVTFATVTGTSITNGSPVEYNFAIKSGKKSKELREKTPIRETFQQEIKFYNTYYPMLSNFQKEKNVRDAFKSIVKCYKTLTFEDMEVIILDNLNSMGYQLHEKTKPMNLNHLKCILREYGKFHAISLAMRDQRPNEFKKVTTNFGDIFKDFCQLRGFPDMIHNMFRDVCQFLKARGELDLLDEIIKLDENFDNILINSAESDDPQSVILHGDCWNNNFMFKYKDEIKSNPSEMYFIDWQLIKMGSPALDIGYLLYTCASKEELNHFDELLEEYYKSLSSHLRKLGSDPQKVFSFEDLNRHWEKHKQYGFIMGIFILKFVLCGKGDAPDFAEDMKSGKDFADVISFTIKDRTLYDDRVLGLAQHFVNYHK